MQLPDALTIVVEALIAAIAPPEQIDPPTWAERELTVPDGPRKLDLWSRQLTPFVAEPLSHTSIDSPVNEFCVMKSAQTGFTTLMIAGIGHTIDIEPCDQMIVQPTDGALTDFNSKKLQIAIDNSEALSRKVAPQTARSGKASTTYEKRYGACSLTLALASSTADLRSKSVRKAWCDEIDEYAEDLDGQGSPFDMIEARQESFLADGSWKRIYVSTPTIKGGSHIERYWEGSDKRKWFVKCPHCRDETGENSEFVFEFGPNFRYDDEWPYRAYYVAPCCGSVVEEHEKRELVRAGRWKATDPGPGKMPGYHFNAMSSPFVPWPKIAERAVKAGSDIAKQKTFYNLTLGLPFEMKGDAPDHVRLFERREDGLPRYRVPPAGLLLTAAADVQMRGIWYEITAWAPNGESWTVDAGYCDGDTSSPDGEAFALLHKATLGREFDDAFGGKRSLDALGIDSGYRSHVVYSWVRQNQRLHPDTGKDVVLALDGRDGWALPAIGMPKLVDIDLGGHKIKQGCKLWPVGTWSLKGSIYDDLRKDGLKSGALRDPDGYCHFGTWLDMGYFEQITAEYLADEKFRGRSRKVWKVRRDNHLLDCRVYNKALAEYLGLSTTTADEWAALARYRGLPADVTKRDLFSPPEPTPQPPPAAEADPEPVSGDWIGRRGRNWLR
nr:terminase gpA endonuclease subunit [Methylobacterium sp. ZNC0032]